MTAEPGQKQEESRRLSRVGEESAVPEGVGAEVVVAKRLAAAEAATSGDELVDVVVVGSNVEGAERNGPVGRLEDPSSEVGADDDELPIGFVESAGAAQPGDTGTDDDRVGSRRLIDHDRSRPRASGSGRGDAGQGDQYGLVLASSVTAATRVSPWSPDAM